jgi:lipoprotein-anchoring transpeptidase ErfK/SrfK
MRRLVAISNKTSKALSAVAVLTIALTSIHLAAAARVASLRREQERLEQIAISSQPSALSQETLSQALKPANQKPNNAGAAERQATNTASGQRSGFADANRVTLPAAARVSAAGISSAGVSSPNKRQVLISIADRKLAVVEGGQVLKVYPIAVGTRGTPSPEGDFVIVNRAKDPTYRHAQKQIAPGKDNPLGTRWMGLNLKGYGIHGTNAPNSVGKAASHGCFRLRKQDVEELYTLVQVGDAVTVRRERDAMIARVFAAPGDAPAEVTAKAQTNAEVQVASASATATAESTEQ